MAVSVSTSAQGTTLTPNATTNGYLIYIAAGEQNAFTGLVTSATFGGQAMTLVAQDALSGNQLFYNVYAIKQSGLDAQSGDNFVPTWDTAPSGASVRYIGIQFEGVDQTTPIGTPNIVSNSSGAPASPANVSCNADGALCEFAGTGNGSTTWTWTNFTSQQEVDVAGYEIVGATRLISSTTTYDGEYSVSPAANRSFEFLVALNAAGAAAANPKGPFGMPFNRPFQGPFR